MKRRNGHVTNSSSASFILSITANGNKAFSVLAQEFVPSWNLDYLQNEIVDAIKRTKAALKEYKESTDTGSHVYAIRILSTILKKSRNILERVKAAKGNQEKLFLLMLEWNHLTILELTEKNLIIKGETIMFNSTDDIPSLLKEMVTFLSIKYGNSQWSFRAESDNEDC